MCEPEFNSREAEVCNSKALISETLESPRKSDLWIMIFIIEYVVIFVPVCHSKIERANTMRHARHTKFVYYSHLMHMSGSGVMQIYIRCLYQKLTQTFARFKPFVLEDFGLR